VEEEAGTTLYCVATACYCWCCYIGRGGAAVVGVATGKEVKDILLKVEEVNLKLRMNVNLSWRREVGKLDKIFVSTQRFVYVVGGVTDKRIQTLKKINSLGQRSCTASSDHFFEIL